MCDECAQRENEAVARLAKAQGVDITVMRYDDGTQVFYIETAKGPRAIVPRNIPVPT